MYKDQILRQLNQMKDSLHQMNEAIDRRKHLVDGYLDTDIVFTPFARTLIDLNRDLAQMAVTMKELL